MYRFLTFALCSGTLDDGKPWSGFRVVLARYVSSAAKHPVCIDVLKCSSDVQDTTLRSLTGGDAVTVYFDRFGRVASIVSAD